MNPPNKNNMEEMSKRFDEKYTIFNIGEISEQLVPNSMKKEPIKDFIQKELSDQAKEIMEKANSQLYLSEDRIGNDVQVITLEDFTNILTTYIKNE